VLEDLASGGGFVPFAEFSSTFFFDGSSTTTTGATENPGPSNYQIYLDVNNQIVCEASWDSGSDEIIMASTA
jgi:hypothetical protein